MILTGFALIPRQVGNFIKQLVKTTDQVNTISPSCGLSVHDPYAKFCKTCGTKLEQG
jgi:voltage-gated potassium channel